MLGRLKAYSLHGGEGLHSHVGQVEGLQSTLRVYTLLVKAYTVSCHC